MGKIVDYVVLFQPRAIGSPEENLQALREKVLAKISLGYQPFGGISFAPDDYLQAMVKYASMVQ
jgi:hypothetical protein